MQDETSRGALDMRKADTQRLGTSVEITRIKSVVVQLTFVVCVCRASTSRPSSRRSWQARPRSPPPPKCDPHNAPLIYSVNGLLRSGC